MNMIKNNRGQHIGWTETSSNGYTYIYCIKKGMLGYYIPSSDSTFSCSSGFIGYGNQLMRLL